MRCFVLLYALISFALSTFSTESWAQSREQDLAESFVIGLYKATQSDPCQSNCAWKYAAHWPQLSKKHFQSKGADPRKLKITYFPGHERWITTVSRPGYVEIVTAMDKDFIAEVGPETTVANRLQLPVKVVPGEGLRITPEFATSEVFPCCSDISKREFLSRGLDQKFDSIYGGSTARKPVDQSNTGNPQSDGYRILEEEVRKLDIKTTGICPNGRAFTIIKMHSDRVYTGSGPGGTINAWNKEDAIKKACNA